MNFYFQAHIVDKNTIELVEKIEWIPDTMEISWIHLKNGSMIRPHRVKLKIKKGVYEHQED